MKRNKIRYQSTPKKRVVITLTGKVHLQYGDEEAIAVAGKGDLLLHPRCEALSGPRLGDYGSTGYAGYFKLDVHDGSQWQPVIVNDIFPQSEHHFSKSECAIDTATLCMEILRGLAGTALLRTYREHYAPEDSGEEAD
ncbi:MAG: hypothetical protein KGJ06_00130 [Pseudomonadota bacterium]|nr:hypothetical protein [Pseudomonadota bacterium]